MTPALRQGMDEIVPSGNTSLTPDLPVATAWSRPMTDGGAIIALSAFGSVVSG